MKCGDLIFVIVVLIFILSISKSCIKCHNLHEIKPTHMKI